MEDKQNDQLLEEIKVIERICQVHDLNDTAKNKRLYKYLKSRRLFNTWVGMSFLEGLKRNGKDSAYRRTIERCCRMIAGSFLAMALVLGVSILYFQIEEEKQEAVLAYIREERRQAELQETEDTEEDNYSKYLEEYELKSLVKKYSDYIAFPITMEVKHDRMIDEEKKEYEEFYETETLNSMVPIWKKNKSDITDEDYNNFYMDKFSDFDNPIKVIHSSVEGMCSYKSLLFIPSHAPYDYFTQTYEKGLALYSNGVMIMEHCAELLPDYFSFVKGVVDSEDLSLNISREILQESNNVKLIAKNIEGKIRRELEDMLKNDRENYMSFFRTFGVQLKYGVYNNFGQDKDKLKDLVMFYSSKKEKLITLSEYVEGMKEGQDKIYYAAGASISKIDALPQVEQVKDKDFDILYLTDYVDEFCVTAIGEYDSKKFANVESGDLGLETEEEKEEVKKVNEESKDLLSAMLEEIGEDVVEVKFSKKLKSHPVCLTTKGDVSIEMQKVFDAMPNDLGIKAQMVLEINEKHPISDKLKDLFENDKEEFNKYTKILYSEARIIAGLPLENPTEISTLICDVISK